MSQPDIQSVLDAQRAWEAALAEGPTRAEAFALRAFDVCAEAIDRMRENLDRAGYPRGAARIPCHDGLEERIWRLEAAMGASIPPVLVAFWRIVGGVSFLVPGHDRFLFETGRGAGQKGPPPGGQLCECDAFVLEPCSEARMRFMIEYPAWGDGEHAGLPLSADAVHKEGFSGGGPYTLLLGAPWAPIVDDLVLYPRASLLVRPKADAGRAARQAKPTFGPSPDLVTWVRSALLEYRGFPGLRQDHPVLRGLLEGVPIF